MHTNENQSNYTKTNLALLKMFLAQAIQSPTNNNEKNLQIPSLIAPLTKNVNHNGTNNKTTSKIVHKIQSNYKKLNLTLLKCF